jgi:uncharacterized protein
MRINILWKGREYESLENCLVETSSAGTAINSLIVGCYEGKIYKVEYCIKTNPDWQTVFLEINSRHNDQVQHIKLESDGKGNWMHNDKKADQFSGCIDVDIPLTPFTNTLPIRRLTLNKGQSTEIRVIYCDLLEKEIKAVAQKYTCLSPTEYHYENIPNDFEATIQTDGSGFVVDYPSLFVRMAVWKPELKTNE